jgi:plasmid stabilization system protein ParE
MAAEFEVRPEAQDDIEAAALWYEAQREGLGERFVSEVDALIDRIRHHPLQFPLIEAPVRRGLLHRFPYVVYFVAEDEGGGAVLAVLHQHRDPDAWRVRF